MNAEKLVDLDLVGGENASANSEKIETSTEPTVTARVLEKQVDKLVEDFNKLAETLDRPKFEEPIPAHKVESQSKDPLPTENSIRKTEEGVRELRSVPEILSVPKIEENAPEEIVVVANLAPQLEEAIVTPQVDETISGGNTESRLKEAVTEETKWSEESTTEENKIPKTDNPVEASEPMENIPKEELSPKREESVQISQPEESNRENENFRETTESVREEEIIPEPEIPTSEYKQASPTGSVSEGSNTPESQYIYHYDYVEESKEIIPEPEIATPGEKEKIQQTQYLYHYETEKNIPEEKIAPNTDESVQIPRPGEPVKDPSERQYLYHYQFVGESGEVIAEKVISDTNEPVRETAPEEKPVPKPVDSVRISSPVASIREETTFPEHDTPAQVLPPQETVQEGQFSPHDVKKREATKKVFGRMHCDKLPTA